MSDALTIKDTPVSWVVPFTVLDRMQIDAMDADTRALVERYVRACGAVSDTPESESDYARGFDDGVEYAQDHATVEVYYSPRDVERAMKRRRDGAR